MLVILCTPFSESSQNEAFPCCSRGSWLSSGSDNSEDTQEEEDDSSSLPSAVEEPIRELIQQQLETFAADKTVSHLL